MAVPTIKLLSGAVMPLFGFGTFRITEYDSILKSLDAALGCGYRSIDTAQFYQNESHIGQALTILLAKYRLERKDLFITSKLLPGNMTTEKTRSSVEQSLRDLKTDYIDLFLIHNSRAGWLDEKDPKNKDARRESWLEMEKLHAEGKLRSIGVSNYESKHLDEMAAYAKIQPSVLQVEFHPHFCRREFYEDVVRRGIHFQAFTSLGRNDPTLMAEPILVSLAQKYGVSVSHILLAWPLAQGIGVLPKSENPDRVRDNFKALNVKLSNEDVEKIWTLHKNVNYTLCRPWDTV